MSVMAMSKATALELKRIARRRDRAIQVADQALEELRQAVIDARAEGATLNEIADAVGVSFQRAYQLSNE
jgi:hypothetical protein